MGTTTAVSERWAGHLPVGFHILSPLSRSLIHRHTPLKMACSSGVQVGVNWKDPFWLRSPSLSHASYLFPAVLSSREEDSLKGVVKNADPGARVLTGADPSNSNNPTTLFVFLVGVNHSVIGYGCYSCIHEAYYLLGDYPPLISWDSCDHSCKLSNPKRCNLIASYAIHLGFTKGN